MAGVYRARHPEQTVLYRVLFHYFDRFLAEYEGRFEKEYGFFRQIIKEVVERYLDCKGQIRQKCLEKDAKADGPVPSRRRQAEEIAVFLSVLFRLCYNPQHAVVAEVVDARDLKFSRKKF